MSVEPFTIPHFATGWRERLGVGSKFIKAAAVIIHIASLDEPPFQLLLGTDAVCVAEQSDIARIEADRKRRGLSVSTGFAVGGGS
jgi:hypothetical protein